MIGYNDFSSVLSLYGTSINNYAILGVFNSLILLTYVVFERISC